MRRRSADGFRDSVLLSGGTTLSTLVTVGSADRVEIGGSSTEEAVLCCCC